MPIVNREVVSLENGTYEGVITDLKVVSRESQKTGDIYQYLDIFVKPDIEGFDGTLKFGVPYSLSNKTRLGGILMALDLMPEVGSAFDEEILKGKRIVFDVFINFNDFAEIDPSSIKPY